MRQDSESLDIFKKKKKSKNGFHGNALADFVKDMYTASRTKLTSISFSIIVKILV